MISFCVYAIAQRIVDSDSFTSNVRLRWVLLIPMLLFVLYIIWIGVATNKPQAVSEIVKKAALFVFPFSFLLISRQLKERNIQLVLSTFVVGCIITSFVCYGNAVYNIYTTGDIRYPDSDHTDYYFTYFPLTEISDFLPIYLGMYCNLAFVIILCTTLVKPWIKYSIAAYLALFIVLIASKIGILVLVACCVIWVISFIKKYRWAYVTVPVLLVVIIVWKVPFFTERFQVSRDIAWEDPNSRLWSSATFRIAIWTCALDAIREEPVLGYGTGNGRDALYHAFEDRKFTRGILDNYNAHNEFLTTQLDLGITGLVVIVSMFVAPLFLFRRLDFLSFTFLLIAAGTLFIESALVRQKGIVFFAFFYSFLLWHSMRRKAVTPV